MKPANKPVSKIKIILTWTLVVGIMAAIYGFWAWQFGTRRHTPAETAPPDFFRSIFILLVGGVFLVAGVASYCAVIFTNCFTFNFNRPVWKELKVKLYFANIFVPLLVGLGLGFTVSAFLSPALIGMGWEPGWANILPLMGTIAILQFAQLWLLVWSPLERRIITKRLFALGITPAQMQGAFLVGLSNPARSSFKKFGAVEEDVGALWIGDQLIYWGDGEQFGIAREQIVQVERRADVGSTSMLGGIAHVILHVKLPDGSERQTRLHTEGFLTMGQKRKAMDRLADSIDQWHASPTPAAVV